MDARYAAFSAGHPVFYSRPRPDNSEPFAVPQPGSWTEWDHAADEHWVHWLVADSPLPEQGWKIHVSARADNAVRILRFVADYCRRRRLSFKHVRTVGRLQATLAKDCDRSSAGKFITIYPRSDDELRDALIELDASLTGEAGPYILSDLRWRRGPLFVRYGAFRAQFVSDGGERVPAVQDLRTGRLVPDIREAAFTVPDWVTVPRFLLEQQAALDTAPPAGLPLITRAIHYSNAGGVYEATHCGEPVIVKEARPDAGWTPDGRDAVARLEHEERVLGRLPRHPVPQVKATLDVHGHRFLTLSRVPGVPLPVLLATTHPLTVAAVDPAAVSRYREWALTVVDNLRTIVRALHTAGVTHGDLHPANVIVDGTHVHLIDFEMSLDTDSVEVAALGVAEFLPPEPLGPIGRDMYAVACIELHLFLPLLPLLHLDEHAAERLVRTAQSAFDLDDAWARRLLRVIGRPESLTTRRPDPPGAPEVLAQTMADRLRRDATPTDDDRLWPGDPRQFSEPPAALAHGAAGVAAVLDQCGVPSQQEHLDWLRAHRHTDRTGLMDGAAGMAIGFRRLGLHAEADALAVQVRLAATSVADASLYSGLAGVALFLLETETDLLRAADHSRELTDRWRGEGPRRVKTNRGGLLRGASGSALLAIRLFEKTGDPEFLAAARVALDFDLAALTPARDGSLHVNEGWRAQPYLGYGSAGVGMVLLEYLRHDADHTRYRSTVDGILRAASAPLTVQSGLFHGRAGLVHFLSHAERCLGASDGVTAAIDSHVEGLRVHLLSGLRITGDGLMRASCDLATGSAGVISALLAVAALRTGDHAPSPPIPYLYRHHPASRGGDFLGLSLVASESAAR